MLNPVMCQRLFVEITIKQVLENTCNDKMPKLSAPQAENPCAVDTGNYEQTTSSSTVENSGTLKAGFAVAKPASFVKI
ncbi:hypothetical protein [Bacillus vallismortis]|uniref:Uncharacterized protein n=1 Tax=Bacillus vallismortis TaxID=72361 RepID=A0AAP3FVQ5_BACVA|nr:hypothetical protein [Bacillus vallismortis]MBG9771493.1 hypothetical protein [Bacillus vallismortis]MCY8315289.1 hypothetical protein [Bacillus vallismortis]MEC1268883.1 hypothetical protein [Bacillus vallismortis]QAV07975.1 hypothetical protein BV11031_04845 [Bacillus vallismortis]